jgi:hypothetical protein
MVAANIISRLLMADSIRQEKEQCSDLYMVLDSWAPALGERSLVFYSLVTFVGCCLCNMNAINIQLSNP